MFEAIILKCNGFRRQGTVPCLSTTTTQYDDKQRITYTVERTTSGAIISGFEYTYDTLGRIVEEKHLVKNVKICYTYDTILLPNDVIIEYIF